MTSEELERCIQQLSERDHPAAYQSLRRLEAESETSSCVAAYWDIFMALAGAKKSPLRARGLRLLSANARWMPQARLREGLAAYLLHITDEKPTVARQCIQRLPAFAVACPPLAEGLLAALAAADAGRYPDSMEPLIRRDLAAAAEEIQKEIKRQ